MTWLEIKLNQLNPKGYKHQIEQELHALGLEITSIGSTDAWWDDEHWTIAPVYDPQQQWFICFIVDPGFEGPLEKGQGIYKIVASARFPQNWNDESDAIAVLDMVKERFDRKLESFAASLKDFFNSHGK